MRKSDFILKVILISVLYFCWIFSMQAQNSSAIANNYIESNLAPYSLSSEDIQDRVISDQYISKHNGLQHVYYQQTLSGIPVEGAIYNVNIMSDGSVVNANSSFVSNLRNRASGLAKINATSALQYSLRELEISAPKSLNMSVENKGVQRETQFRAFGNIEKDIVSKLMYIKTETKEVTLVWVTEIYTHEPRFHVWKVYVNAETGAIIKKIDQVLECNFGVDESCKKQMHIHDSRKAPLTKNNKNGQATNMYNVFASPVESPLHGNRSIVTDPADPIASPFGWHDTNGSAGAEFTITRGNNVYAQDDENGNNGSGYSPEGGNDLIFNYTLDFAEDPNINTAAAQNLNSAITNLFYWNNIVHDVFYKYGFDEASGNFQQNNYGNGGQGNDHVLADALDGSDSNNARFFTSPDGTNGRMEMYLWTGGGSQATFDVNAPASDVGAYNVVGASFGSTSYDISGDVVIVDDGTAMGSEGCNALINGTELSGKIALIDRGSCEFGLKALNAENAGAIAVIVCNNQPGSPTTMSPGANGASVTIPAIMLGQDDCTTLRLQINDLNVTMKAVANPAQFDGSYDNGIITHEYGHGISTRLTGGPSTNACLTNAEQGGEGWSDFFGLVLSHESGDDRNTSRPIGNYVQGQNTFGGGIRTYPYTTDMSVNPSTYDDVKTFAIPHGIGSILCTMLWDMYWDFVDTYGYSADLYSGNGGNNMAIQLVMDGLKMQPCSPGFIDVRDAILAADIVNYGGVNQCLIWSTFARRGLGVSASQGDSNDRSDGTEAFDIPSGINLDSESVFLEAFEGEIVNISGTATCDCTAKNNVQIQHTLSPGMTLISVENGSESGGIVSSISSNLDPLESISISYTARIDICENSSSAILFEDDVEGLDQFTSSTLSSTGTWLKSSTQTNSGTNAWFALNPDVSSDYALTLNQSIIVDGFTELSFFHRYETEATWDGGVVEVSVNNGSTWQAVDNLFVENGYPSAFDPRGSSPLAGRNSFTGSSDVQFNSSSFVKSVVNLSSYDGENLRLRFRFASDDNTDGGGINGWFIDDILIRTASSVNVPTEVLAGGNSEDIGVISYEVKKLETERVYVDLEASGKRFGGNWTDAMISLREAISLAECNELIKEVWVKAGSYTPTDGTDQNISFSMVDDVTVYGGFLGSETLLAQRNFVDNLCVVSGDIGVVDDNTDNTLHVISNSGVGNSAVLDGFTIRDGNAIGGSGGGLLNTASSPVIRNCIFRDNNADNGGAVANMGNSNASLIDCIFMLNTSSSNVGRAILNDESDILLKDVLIVDSDIQGLGSTVSNSGASGELRTDGVVEIKKME